MGRFWETVKPRDSGYVTGEHIGEIRKPTEKPSGNPLSALKEAAAHELPHVQEKVHDVQERVQERVQEVGLRTAFLLENEAQEMGKQAVKKLSTAFEEARSSGFWQRAQGYLEEKRPLSWLSLGL